MKSTAEFADEQSTHPLDEAALDGYLSQHLEGYSGGLKVRQFQGGQSNPTFLIASGEARYVLRKKPPGQLLATAHMVEREYRILTALGETDVPVPKAHLLCEDESVIGTPFFVMEYLPGRLFWQAAPLDLSPSERRDCFAEKCRVLAALHLVDYRAQGLEDYGRPGNYMSRQIRRWTRQYEASKTEEVPSMDRLIEWLPANVPDDDTTCIVHGDYRFDNLVFHPTQTCVMGVLDWELSTLGHPLADLAYDCVHYHVDFYNKDAPTGPPMLAGLAGPENGIPTEAEYVSQYCATTGRDGIVDWTFYLAFSIFRLASIREGVYRRGLDGIASSAEALERKGWCRLLADRAWLLVESG
jgi:aminoglycoside phosphotransferase (APT) family kinase protein